MSYKDKDVLNKNVRQDLIRMLDANITGFRDIEWRSKSKRFTKKDAKTIKYELVVLITDCYWGHELKHKDDERYYSLYYETLKDKLGKNYRKHIDIVFDIIGGVNISSAFRKDGSTQRYKLKKVVKDICDDLFRKNIKMHSLVGRTGKVMTEWEEYSVSKTNERGEFQTKVDNKKYKFSSKVLLNKNNGTILTHLFSDLYKYKTGRLKKPQVKRWIDIIKGAGGDINNSRRWSGDRLRKLHEHSLEIYNEMMVDIIGEGYVGQLYKERNTGRLFGTGGSNLQGMMREQRRILMGGLGYYEYDMENAHYNIVEQYYKMITGKKLKRITKYIENTKAYRNRLVKETNNSYETIKTCLIAIIYGSGISRMRYKDEDLALWDIVKKQTTNIKTAEKLWYDLTDNIIVKELYTEVDIAYRAIKQRWVETNSGWGRRLKNHSYKTTRINYEDVNGEIRPKSKGKLLSHFLQGIEARILLGIIREEGKDGFIMPHHDGWVSKVDWDTDRLQELIGKDTRKMLLDYNGDRGAFDIPIKKVELTDIVDGDWKDLIIKKGVVSSVE